MPLHWMRHLPVPRNEPGELIVDQKLLVLVPFQLAQRSLCDQRRKPRGRRSSKNQAHMSTDGGEATTAPMPLSALDALTTEAAALVGLGLAKSGDFPAAHSFGARALRVGSTFTAGCALQCWGRLSLRWWPSRQLAGDLTPTSVTVRKAPTSAPRALQSWSIC